jgi:hypothetical protein
MSNVRFIGLESMLKRLQLRSPNPTVKCGHWV